MLAEMRDHRSGIHQHLDEPRAHQRLEEAAQRDYRISKGIKSEFASGEIRTQDPSVGTTVPTGLPKVELNTVFLCKQNMLDKLENNIIYEGRRILT